MSIELQEKPETHRPFGVTPEALEYARWLQVELDNLDDPEAGDRTTLKALGYLVNRRVVQSILTPEQRAAELELYWVGEKSELYLATGSEEIESMISGWGSPVREEYGEATWNSAFDEKVYQVTDMLGCHFTLREWAAWAYATGTLTTPLQVWSHND